MTSMTITSVLLVVAFLQEAFSITVSINGPLEVSEFSALSFTCEATPLPFGGADILLVEGNGRTQYVGEDVSSSSNVTHKTFKIRDVLRSRNGTLLGCTVAGSNSDLLPILVLSSPLLFDYFGQNASNTVNLTLNEGDSRQISVSVGGYPSPMASSERVSGGSGVGSSLTASLTLITIFNINRRDAGLYKFNYSNIEGYEILFLDLMIQYVPTFIDRVSDEFICDMASSPVQCVAMLGKNGSFNCQFASFPAGRLNASIPMGSGAYFNQSGNKISIIDATIAESGRYDCTVNNTIFKSVRSINFLVGSVPASVTNTKANVDDVGSVTIIWKHDNQNNAIPVRNFTITGGPVNDMGQDFSVSVGAGMSQVVIDLSLLSPDTDYSATITVYNLLGASSSMDILFSTTPVTVTMASPVPERNVGAVVGGVISSILAALIVIVIAVFVVLKFGRRSKEHSSYRPAGGGSVDELRMTPADKKLSPDIGTDINTYTSDPYAPQKEITYAELDNFKPPTAENMSPVEQPVAIQHTEEPVEYATIDSFKKVPPEGKSEDKTGTPATVV